MKLTGTPADNKPRLRIIMIHLFLVSTLLFTVTAFSNTTTNSQISESPAGHLSNSTTTSETPAINPSNHRPPPATYRKKNTLNEDSRGLSTFLLIGIIINIIMASIFAWWFSTQWRQTKK